MHCFYVDINEWFKCVCVCVRGDFNIFSFILYSTFVLHFLCISLSWAETCAHQRPPQAQARTCRWHYLSHLRSRGRRWRWADRARAAWWGTRRRGARLWRGPCCDLSRTGERDESESSAPPGGTVGPPHKPWKPADETCEEGDAGGKTVWCFPPVDQPGYCSSAPAYMVCLCNRSPGRGSSSWILSQGSWRSQTGQCLRRGGMRPEGRNEERNHETWIVVNNKSGFRGWNLWIQTSRDRLLISF